MEYWETEQQGGISIVGYKNPPTNYLIAPATIELNELIGTWRAPDIRAVVLTGAVPERYITHYSVEELVAMGDEPGYLREAAHGLIYGYHSLLRSLAYLDVPIVVQEAHQLRPYLAQYLLIYSTRPLVHHQKGDVVLPHLSRDDSEDSVARHLRV